MTTDLGVHAADEHDLVALLANLPGPERVGDVDLWVLPSDGKIVKSHAKLLGTSSSHREYQHAEQHPNTDYAKPNQRCAACRWFVPRIFREIDGEHRFLVHRTGMSIVPGEVTRTRHDFLSTGHEVVESLTLRRRHDRNAVAQKCPVCDGTGLVSRPPGVAGDQNQWSSNQVSTFPCRTCKDGVLYPEPAFLTTPAARVLAQAAGHDHDLDEAYINRAVL